MTPDTEPVRICIAEVAQDMCGRCARPLRGSTGGTLNHWYAGDLKRAICCAIQVSGKRFKPAPRFCMLLEEDHRDNIPEIVEALRHANWNHVPHYSDTPYGIESNKGLLRLARPVAGALKAEAHAFIPGTLCPTCNGERLFDEVVGSVPGLRDGTRMPVVSGRKILCAECKGVGVIPNSQ